MDQIDAWQGPAIVGFFHEFAEPDVEHRFLTAMLAQNRLRALLVIAIAALVSGTGVLARQIGFFSEPVVFRLWPALVQLAVCGVATLALWRFRGVRGTEYAATGFGIAYIAARCIALVAQPALADSAPGVIMGTICLLFLGLPVRPAILLPLMAIGSGVMAAVWGWQHRGVDSAAIGQMLEWIVITDIVLGAGLRLFRYSVRRQWAQAQALQHMAVHDELTGAANRRAYESALTKEWLRCQSIGAPLSLVMLDVDFFKLLNDSIGHAAGDACLRDLARLLESCLSRPGQILARTGGEEFTILLPETNEMAARSVARRVLDTIRDAAIAHPCSPLGAHLTVSLGVATGRAGEGFAAWELTALADRLVYSAKREGRNRLRQESLGVEAPPAPAGRLDAAGRQIAVGWKGSEAGFL